MKRSLLIISTLVLSFTSLFAKKNLAEIAAEIATEGKILYKIDMASWLGTDILKEHYLGSMDSLGGYFSYVNEERSYCIFYSRYDFNKVVFEASFDSTYELNMAKYNYKRRAFNSKELELFTMRERAAQLLKTDTIFKFYKNTTPNLIPLIYNGERKVYIITGTTLNNMVPLGNDYLLQFDKNLNVKKTTKIHKNFIPIENKNNDTSLTTMHSHLASTGDFITPTDICTIMEYEKIEKWKAHYVISNDYISIWDCEKDRLLILEKDVWQKISKDAEKRMK